MTTGFESFSDELFYDNLTLNLTKSLDWIPGVHNIKINKKEACEKASLISWEQRQCCQLPYDLKNFYLSVDGFELTYDYKYAGELLPVGRLYINSLAELKRLFGCTNEPSTEVIPSIKDLDIVNHLEGKPSFGSSSKIFELDYNEGVSMICLVYNDSNHSQEIWFLDRSLNWFKLADNFSQYFRMMLYHHGLPEWQFLHAGIGLSPWSEQLMIAIAPHLLSPEGTKKIISRTSEPQIDPNIFKGLGGALMWLGVRVASDPDYVNLSQLLHGSLPRPLLYYLTFSVIVLGTVIASLAMLACSAVALLNKLLFALLIFGVIVLLIGETALIIFIAVTPKYLGLAIDKEQLVDNWQRNYGVPGREQYTAAIDYIQSTYGCCGADKGKDFMSSWWKLRELAAPDLVVPLSCCIQLSSTSHLDPLPANQTACQDEDFNVHRSARHTQSCADSLSSWLESSIRRALEYSILCIIFQLYVLLLAIYACLQFFSKKKT